MRFAIAVSIFSGGFSHKRRQDVVGNSDMVSLDAMAVGGLRLKVFMRREAHDSNARTLALTSYSSIQITSLSVQSNSGSDTKHCPTIWGLTDDKQASMRCLKATQGRLKGLTQRKHTRWEKESAVRQLTIGHEPMKSWVKRWALQAVRQRLH